MPDAPAHDPTRQRLAQTLDELAQLQLDLHHERLQRGQVEASYTQLLASISDALLLVDARGQVVRANAAAATLLGASEDELTDMHAADLLGGDIPPSAWDLVRAGPAGLTLEAELKRVDGTTVAVSVSCAALRGEDGRVLGALYAARDLTATQRLLREVAQTEARWRLVARVGELLASDLDPRVHVGDALDLLAEIAGCGAGVVVVQDGMITDVLHGARAPGHGLLDDLAGRPLEPDTSLADAVDHRRTSVAGRLAADFPLLRRAGGNAGIAAAAVLPVLGRARCLGALVLASPSADAIDARTTDLAASVADRIGMALGNAHLARELSELSASQRVTEARHALLASLSHDMKTPLTVITGLVEMIQDDPELMRTDTAHVRTALARQSRRLRHLVVQFLDYTRLEAGRELVLDRRSTDLGPILQQIAEISLAPDRVRIEVPDDLPRALVDPDRIDQVLANLVDNACAHTPPTSGTITVVAGTAGDVVEISVSDHGPGIAPRDVERIFEKFGRATTSSQGTGLGLYVSRQLVEAMGGRLLLRTEPGRGSTFTVALPRDDDVGAPA